MIAMFMFGSFSTQAFVAWYYCNVLVNVVAALAVIDHHRLEARRRAHKAAWDSIYAMEAAVDAKWAEWSFDNCPCQRGEMCSRCEEHLLQAYDQPEECQCMGSREDCYVCDPVPGERESKYSCDCGRHYCEICDPDPQDRKLKEEKDWEASYDLDEYEAISLSHGKSYEDIMAERAYQAKMAKEADLNDDLPF